MWQGVLLDIILKLNRSLGLPLVFNKVLVVGNILFRVVLDLVNVNVDVDSVFFADCMLHGVVLEFIFGVNVCITGLYN
jgi:hypothetical protein